jgi:hypothetical protein
MKSRVERAASYSVRVGPGPAFAGIRPRRSGTEGERGLDRATKRRGKKNDECEVADSGPARLVADSASVAFGSVPAALGSFSALELERIIPVPQAADINNQHEDTFRRNFPHLIRKIGKRKTGVKLRDAITLPPAPIDAA